MKVPHILLAPAAFVVVAAVATLAQVNNPAGARMIDAARRFVDGLAPEQRAKAVYPVDSPERLKWNFVPLQDAQKRPTRKGVRFEEMTAPQREAALDLLKTGTSEHGYTQATTIMSLEDILRDLEKGGRIVRDPGWYFVTVFGSPERAGKWGWRIEGHHLSINYLLDKGEVVAATPAFFGANPATVRDGAKKGLRAIPDVDDLAKQLYKSLDESQRQQAQQPSAKLPNHQFPEVSATPAAKVGQREGVPASALSDGQRTTLDKLIHAYLDRLPPDVGRMELDRIEKAGLEKVCFAFAGGTEAGEQHTYRVQGPTFVAEFLEVQDDSAKNPANHIHSVWRHLPKDFGLSASE
jgi:hypothetical protein